MDTKSVSFRFIFENHSHQNPLNEINTKLEQEKYYEKLKELYEFRQNYITAQDDQENEQNESKDKMLDDCINLWLDYVNLTNQLSK